MFLSNPMSRFIETSKTKIGNGLLLVLPHCFHVIFHMAWGYLGVTRPLKGIVMRV